MIRPAVLVAGVACAALLMLAGCSSGDSVHPGAVPSSAGGSGATTPAADSRPRSADGAVLLASGEQADLTLPDGRTATGHIRVASVAVDPGCDNPAAQPARNGHYVIATVHAEATAALGRATPPVLPLAWALWTIRGADGAVVPGAAAILCTTDLFDATLSPGQSASGTVAFDVAATSGTVGIAVPGTTASFEWPFG